MTEHIDITETIADTALVPGPVIIEVVNPTKEEMDELRVSIKETFNFNVNVKDTTFKFKKSVDKATGIETIRKPVDLAIPYVSVEGIMAILEAGGKGLELLLDVVETTVATQAREVLYEDMSYTAATFPVDKLSWEFIANIPKVQRRGGGIPKETWEAFAVDYIAIMPDVTGKKVEMISNMAKILVNKLVAVRTSEAVLNLCVEQLAIYADNAPNIGDYVECVEFLLNKAETLLNVDPADLLSNL